MFSQEITTGTFPKRLPNKVSGILERGNYQGAQRWMIKGPFFKTVLLNIGPVARAKRISLWKLLGKGIMASGVPVKAEIGKLVVLWVSNFQPLSIMPV